MKKPLTILAFSILATIVMAQEAVYTQANAAFQNAAYSTALEHYKTAGDHFARSANPAMYASCKLGEAECYLGLGNIQAARATAIESSGFISTNLSEQKDLQARSKMIVGDVYLRSGRNDLALEQLKAAESLLDESSLEAAACFDDLGVIYTTNENKELALQYLQKALAIRQSNSEDQILIADSYNNIGRVYLNDEPLQGIIYFNKALEIYTKAYGKTHPKVAICYSNMAFANANQNNYNDALNYLKLVKDIYEEIYDGPHPNKAFTLNNQGRIMESRGDYTTAFDFQRQALEMYLQLYGEKHPEVANTYFLMGSILQKQSSFMEAATHFQQSIYANLVDQSYNDIYQLPEIRDYYNADILLSSLQSKARSLESHHFNKSLKLRDIDGALEALRKCDELITEIRHLRFNESDKLRLANIASEVYENGISIAVYMSNRTFKKDHYLNQAFEFNERSKSAILLEAIGDAKAKQFAGIPDKELMFEDSLKNEIGFLELQLAESHSEKEVQEIKIRLLEYQNSLRNFISGLEKEYPEYFKLKYDTRLAGIADIQAILDENTAVLSYFISDDRIYTFMITAQKAQVTDNPQDDQFIRMSRGFRNAIKYNVDETFTQTSILLHDQLIPKMPQNINKLIIIPDTEISAIPFEALVIEEAEDKTLKNNTYLLEKYAISYDYAATLMLNRMNTPSTNRKKNGILLTAPVSFENNEVFLQPLPDSRKEINEIRYLFVGSNQKATTILEQAASEKMIKSDDLEEYKYVHFATHGVVDQARPELSRIFLSPDDEEDGSLYSGEIYNLKIGADLVTLSACETGLGKAAKGEGIVGLSRALQYAGARNLIVSLWQVADASTATLMIEFYNQHLRRNDNPYFSNDLRTAKLSLLRSDDYYNPYYWAPFILIGH